MSEAIEQAFIDAIIKDPDDDDARAVYADWLDERNDLRGEYLRIELQLYRGPARLTELTKSINPSWIAVIARVFDVVLGNPGPSMIMVIKTVREVTGLGLKDAKGIVDRASDQAPVVVRAGLDRREAEETIARFDGTGARLEMVQNARPLTSWSPGDETDVVLVSVVSSRKIYAIKLVRELTNLGLAEAKTVVESLSPTAPFTLVTSVDRPQAAAIANSFAGIGELLLRPTHR